MRHLQFMVLAPIAMAITACGNSMHFGDQPFVFEGRTFNITTQSSGTRKAEGAHKFTVQDAFQFLSRNDQKTYDRFESALRGELDKLCAAQDLGELTNMNLGVVTTTTYSGDDISNVRKRVAGAFDCSGDE